MPSGWVHATFDLITCGRPYFDLHKQKDKDHDTLGPEHRIVNHEWYWAFRKHWTLSDPFPPRIKNLIHRVSDAKGANKAEEKMVWIAHDYLDRLWNVLSESERWYCETFLIWVLSDTQILRVWAGVDVLKGKIQRIVEGEEIWEDCPELAREYKRLCPYVGAVRRNEKALRDMLRRYG